MGAARLRKSGNYELSGGAAAKYIEDIAKALGIKLRKVTEEELERTRQILGRGTPLSYLIREMREGK